MSYGWNLKQFVLKRKLQCFIVLCALLLSYHVFIVYFVPPSFENITLYRNLKIENVDPIQACQVPLFHPFEADVLSYFKAASPIICRSRESILTFIDSEGYLRYNMSAFRESGYSLASLTCTYQEIIRDPASGAMVYSEAKHITGMEKPESDFTYVSCSRFSWMPARYTNYHAHVQPRPNIRQFADSEELSVSVIGIDSVSRLNFMRQLPKSYAVLTETLGAVVFKGFNKVGANTLPNIVPILTGNPPPEISSVTTFDEWPFIWNHLKMDNVATLYGEDIARIATFNWWGAGFLHEPTHHYFTQFWATVDSSSLSSFSSPMCLGPVPKHQIYLNYLKSFLIAYRSSPSFMFSLENEPCHDYMNRVGVIDDDLAEFLMSSYMEGLLNRTVLFVIGDHGHRFDPFRSTEKGRLEDSMPMVSMVMPEWVYQRYPQLNAILDVNSKRLSSSYDLYSTFIDIYQGKSFNISSPKSLNFEMPKFGQSLLKPIPLNRSCPDAGVPGGFCICKQEKVTLGKNDSIVLESVAKVLSYINNEVLLADSDLWQDSRRKHFAKMQEEGEDWTTAVSFLGHCAHLSVAEIEEAYLVNEKNGSKLVLMKFSTSPNDGIYEARVEWTSPTEGTLCEGVNRVNRYENQADCLPKSLLIIVPFVRSACYCL